MVSSTRWMGTGLAAAVLACSAPLFAKGGTGFFQVTHMAGDPAWKVEFAAPADKEQVKAGPAALPADRTVAIGFRKALLFTFDRTQCGSARGIIQFALVDSGGARIRLQADDAGVVTFLDAAAATANAGVLKLVQAKDSQTGITTLAISGDALKR